MRIAVLAGAASALLLAHPDARAATYDIGPGQTYQSIADAPWASLAPGDHVQIHWKNTAYNEKWVICAQGTEDAPIVVGGVPGPSGQLPVIDGNGAVTPTNLNFWNEDRGIVKIGGASVPSCSTPAWIVLENLEIHSARSAYSFTARDGSTGPYLDNAAAVYLELVQHVTVRNCVLHDTGNGLQGGGDDVLIEGNSIYDSGEDGSCYQHNTYTGGNGGHVIVEPDNASNGQIVHYGGDQGNPADYRTGTLYFYSNTVVSQRSSFTTLFALSGSAQHADARDNIFHVTADGSALAMLADDGLLDLADNYVKPGWVDSHDTLLGTINDSGWIEAASPGFVNEGGADYHLAAGSPCVGAAGALAAGAPPVTQQYQADHSGVPRPDDGDPDIGAFERCDGCVTVPDASPGGADAPPGHLADGAASGADASDSGGHDDAGGCGCRLAPLGPAGGGLVLAVLALLLLSRRR